MEQNIMFNLNSHQVDECLAKQIKDCEFAEDGKLKRPLYFIIEDGRSKFGCNKINNIIGKRLRNGDVIKNDSIKNDNTKNDNIAKDDVWLISLPLSVNRDKYDNPYLLQSLLIFQEQIYIKTNRKYLLWDTKFLFSEICNLGILAKDLVSIVIQYSLSRPPINPYPSSLSLYLGKNWESYCESILARGGTFDFHLRWNGIRSSKSCSKLAILSFTVTDLKFYYEPTHSVLKYDCNKLLF